MIKNEKELKVTSYLHCKQTSARVDSFFIVYIKLNIFIYLNFIDILSVTLAKTSSQNLNTGNIEKLQAVN